MRSELKTSGPEIDPARHQSCAVLEAGVRALPALPRDAGRLVLIVRRLADGSRETPASVLLTPADGVPGDKWGRRAPRDPHAQLAVMRRDLAELIANGQPLTLFGDNLFVDFDLSAANLPAGTRLRLGAALVEVSPKLHQGCSKFRRRFGTDAFKFVWAAGTEAENRRGVYWRVVTAGEVAVGAAIEVASRA